MAHKALWPFALASIWLILAGYLLREGGGDAAPDAPQPVPTASPADAPPAPANPVIRFQPPQSTDATEGPRTPAETPPEPPRPRPAPSKAALSPGR